MPRTKGSKNRVKTDFDAQIAKLQKDKALLEHWGQAPLTKVQIMSKNVEFSKTKKVAKFVTI